MYDQRNSSTGSFPSSDVTQPSTASLFTQLVDALGDLVRGELALAKAETAEQMEAAQAGLVKIAVGAGLALCGLIALTAAAIALLAQTFSVWIAALIIGVATGLAGYFSVQSGTSEFSATAFSPDRTLKNLRKDYETIKEKSNVTQR